MRLAILSDIHGNLRALEAVLADLKTVGADLTWVLGDLAAFCPEPAECVQAVQALPEATTKVIQGNTDRYVVTGARPTWPPQTEETWPDVMALLRDRDRNFGWTTERLDWAEAEYLLKLPTDLSVEVEDYGWVVGFHAAPGDDELVLLPDTAEDELLDALLDRAGRLAFGGHTHRPMDRALENDQAAWRFINPGSVGLPFDGDQRAAYALVTFENGEAQAEIRRVEYDVDAVIKRLAELEHPAQGWVGERLRTARPPH